MRPISIMARVDAAIAEMRSRGEEPVDVVMNDDTFACYMVQGEADTWEHQPTTIRKLPIIRVRDGMSAVRADGEWPDRAVVSID
jgi:hypothetical protein